MGGMAGRRSHVGLRRAAAAAVAGDHGTMREIGGPGRLAQPARAAGTGLSGPVLGASGPRGSGLEAIALGQHHRLLRHHLGAAAPALIDRGVPAIAAHLALLDAADLVSNLALAAGLQSAGCSLHGRIAPWRRALSSVVRFRLMLPTRLTMDALGLVLIARAWSGALLVPLVRRTAAALGQGRQR